MTYWSLPEQSGALSKLPSCQDPKLIRKENMEFIIFPGVKWLKVTRSESHRTYKAAHSGFETQRRHHQESKTEVSVAPQKGLVSSKNFKRNG